MKRKRWSVITTVVKATSSAEISIITSSVVMSAMPRSLVDRMMLASGTVARVIPVGRRQTPHADGGRNVIAHVAQRRLRQLLRSHAKVNVHLFDHVGGVGDAADRLRQRRQPLHGRRGRIGGVDEVV